MRRSLVIVLLLGTLWAGSSAVAQLPSFQSNTPLQAEQLNALVRQINGLTGAGLGQVINANCATLGQALQQASPGDTIQLPAGTCTVGAGIMLTQDRLSLVGQGSGTILDGAGSASAVVTIAQARGVTVRNLTVRRGMHGIRVDHGAVAFLEGITAEDNILVGIGINENAAARIMTCTAQRNGDDGFSVVRATALFSGAIVSIGNGGAPDTQSNDGITITSHATAGFDSTVTITTTNNMMGRGLNIAQGSQATFSGSGAVNASTNGTDGIAVVNGSSLFVSNLTAPMIIQGNGDRGLEIGNASTLNMQNSTATISTNSRDGIGVFNSSSLNLQSTSAPVIVQGNRDRGVEIANTSTLSVQNQSMLQVTGSTTDGIGVFGSSRFIVSTGSTVLVESNGDDGLDCAQLCSANFIDANTLLHARLNNNRGVSVDANATLNVGAGATATIESNRNTGVNSSRVSSLTVGGILTVRGNNTNNNVNEHGVEVSENALLTAGAGAMVTIENNAIGGMQISRNAFVRFQGTDMVVRILTNGAEGIFVQQDAGVRFDGGADRTTVEISGHTTRGLRFQQGSHGDISNITVQNNGQTGLDVTDTSLQLATSTIMDHSTADVALRFGTHAFVNGNTLGRLTCDTTVIRSGNNVCQ